jgi:hypothetical protein
VRARYRHALNAQTLASGLVGQGEDTMQIYKCKKDRSWLRAMVGLVSYRKVLALGA